MKLKTPTQHRLVRTAAALFLMSLTAQTACAETVIATYMKADGTTSTHEATVINENDMPTAGTTCKAAV